MKIKKPAVYNLWPIVDFDSLDFAIGFILFSITIIEVSFRKVENGNGRKENDGYNIFTFTIFNFALSLEFKLK